MKKIITASACLMPDACGNKANPEKQTAASQSTAVSTAADSDEAAIRPLIQDMASHKSLTAPGRFPMRSTLTITADRGRPVGRY